MASTADIGEAMFGTFTKPVEEYRQEQRWREREAKRNASQAGKATDTGGEAYRDSDGASTHSRLPDAQPARTYDAGARKGKSIAATTAGASARSFGMIVPKAAMSLVNIPLAFTEGLRSVPANLGAKVRDHGPVTGVVSGTVVAGKNLAWGFADGFGDLVMEPVRGGKEEGVGRGAVSFFTKPSAGALGLLAYPTAGVARSVRTLVHGATGKLLTKARVLEGRWLQERGQSRGVDGNALLKDFYRLRNGKGGAE